MLQFPTSCLAVDAHINLKLLRQLQQYYSVIRGHGF